MFMKPPSPPNTKGGPSKGTPTAPGTQKTTGVKTKPAYLSKTGKQIAPFAGARRLAGATAETKGKHAIPRAAVETRAKPKAEY